MMAMVAIAMAILDCGGNDVCDACATVGAGVVKLVLVLLLLQLQVLVAMVVVIAIVFHLCGGVMFPAGNLRVRQ